MTKNSNSECLKCVGHKRNNYNQFMDFIWNLKKGSNIEKKFLPSWTLDKIAICFKDSLPLQFNCQAQVQFQVPNPSHKFWSKKLKSKVQRKRNGTGADIIILQATTPPPHPLITFLTSHLKCPSSVRIRPSPN